MWESVQKASLSIRLLGYILAFFLSPLERAVRIRALSWISHQPLLLDGEARSRNIVIIGASFAGYHAARVIATSLPRSSPFRVVVIEPNSHFNFTWVLPRFCVVEGHEHKAFVPYGGYLSAAPKGSLEWIHDRVESVGREGVRLCGGREIPYEYLVLATGATAPNGLPSRVETEDKASGMELLRNCQLRIKHAEHIVVAGGGAAGVEIAMDAKAAYPLKRVVLVHSRKAVMHRFSPGLQKTTSGALEQLGVEVILEDKVVSEDTDDKKVLLTSGKTIDCDCFVSRASIRALQSILRGVIQLNCTGQTPASGLLVGLAAAAISSSGQVSVKPTLQITDDSLPNVYACGDVAETNTPNPNARSAMRQAEIVSDNLLLSIHGKKPRYTYKPQWGDGLIKLTLGLVSEPATAIGPLSY